MTISTTSKLQIRNKQQLYSPGVSYPPNKRPIRWWQHHYRLTKTSFYGHSNISLIRVKNYIQILCIEIIHVTKYITDHRTVMYVNIRTITCFADDRIKPRYALPLVFPLERYRIRNQNTSVNQAWSMITAD
jgi:hypothetical protein